MTEDPPPSGAHHRILRGAAIVLCASAGIRLAGLAKELTIAATFGRGDALEIFIVALLIPATIANLIGGSLHQALLPIYLRRRLSDPAAADRLFNRTLLAGLAVLLGLSVVAILAAETLIPLLASGFTDEKAAAAIALVPLLTPVGVLSGIAILLSVPLHARERFWMTTLGPAATPLTTIACMWASGWTGTTGPLVAGTLLGGLIEIVVLVVALGRAGHDATIRAPLGGPGLSAIVRQARPLLAGMSFQSAIGIVETTLATTLAAGSLAGLAYAQRLVMMPITLITTALGNVCFPVLSSELAARGPAAMRRVLWRWQWIILGGGACLAVALVIAAEPLVEFLYRRGAFDRNDAEAVSSLLRIYACLLPVYVSGVVSARALSALQRNTFLCWISLGNLVMTIVLNLTLFPHLGLHSIPITAVLVYTGSAIANGSGVAYATRGAEDGDLLPGRDR